MIINLILKIEILKNFGMIGLWQTFLLALILFPIIALVDVIRNEFTGNNKLIWVLVLIFFNIPGAILYYLIGTKQKLKKPFMK